jgi:hypothetical protein
MYVCVNVSYNFTQKLKKKIAERQFVQQFFSDVVRWRSFQYLKMANPIWRQPQNLNFVRFRYESVCGGFQGRRLGTCSDFSKFQNGGSI